MIDWTTKMQTQALKIMVDVWEHSYYIDFRNKRPAYLANFLDKLVNWEAVAANLSGDHPPTFRQRPVGDRPDRPFGWGVRRLCRA